MRFTKAQIRLNFLCVVDATPTRVKHREP